MSSFLEHQQRPGVCAFRDYRRATLSAFAPEPFNLCVH
jgi:hypothetical protein